MSNLKFIETKTDDNNDFHFLVEPVILLLLALNYCIQIGRNFK